MIKEKKDSNLRIISLGGLGEVGRNMMLIEYNKKILICDMGFRMPEEDMPGIDFVIPNISYLKGREKDIVGIIITHGHYDHIGAIPYLIYRFPFNKYPMFASGLARGIILKRQDDFPLQPKLDIKKVKNGSKINLDPFKVEFFAQNHNISDNLGALITTPVGNIIHTSDFKFDRTPTYDSPTDFKKLESFGKRKILFLMSDSTSAEEPGHSLSEKDIFENLDNIFKETKGRIITATFGSLINRIQQIISLSEKYGRKVIIEGYSMKSNVEICKRLGYIKANKGTLIKAKDIDKYPDDKITLLCTGAQGEGQAVLMRITNKEHPFIKFKEGDTIVFSSSVIPGNERTVQMLKDNILRQKAKIFHYKMMDIHAGGHGHEEELKKMIELIKPKFFMPIHGQYSMLSAHAEIAKKMGIPEKNIVIAENGDVVNLSQNKIYIEEKKVPFYYVMVDGLGVGDVEEVVLRDRNALSQDGIFVIIIIVDKQTGTVKGSPDIISRGFVYLKESKDLLSQTRKKVINIVNNAMGNGGAVNLVYIKNEIKNKMGQFFYTKTQRRPMVLPVIIEV